MKRHLDRVPVQSDARRSIHAALADAGLSGRALARELGMSKSAIGRRLNGAMDFRTAELEAIAKALDISLSDLLQWPESTSPESIAS